MLSQSRGRVSPGSICGGGYPLFVGGGGASTGSVSVGARGGEGGTRSGAAADGDPGAGLTAHGVGRGVVGSISGPEGAKGGPRGPAGGGVRDNAEEGPVRVGWEGGSSCPGSGGATGLATGTLASCAGLW